MKITALIKTYFLHLDIARKGIEMEITVLISIILIVGILLGVFIFAFYIEIVKIKRVKKLKNEPIIEVDKSKKIKKNN